MRSPLVTACIILSWTAGCGSRDTSPPPTQQAARPRAQLPHLFVRFTRERVVLRALETPTTPPVALGSTPLPTTMASDDPTVVSVGADGALVAHRDGTTRVRPLAGGSPLDVTVRAARSLHVEPQRLYLQLGDRRPLALRADDDVVERSDVSWASTDPSVAYLVDDRIVAAAPGTARVIARHAGREAEAVVVVTPPGAQALMVAPPTLATHPGNIVSLHARMNAVDQPGAVWTSRDPAILRQLDGPTFRAERPGTTQACATVLSLTRCAQVQVLR